MQRDLEATLGGVAMCLDGARSCERQLECRPKSSQRGAEFVGCMGRESVFASECALQSREEVVELLYDRLELLGGIRDSYPLVQAPLVQRADLAAEQPERVQTPANDPGQNCRASQAGGEPGEQE